MSKEYHFKPWDDFEENPEILPIENPCKYCQHWIPQRLYRMTDGGFVFDGVRLCWVSDQQHDFSCFRCKDPK